MLATFAKEVACIVSYATLRLRLIIRTVNSGVIGRACGISHRNKYKGLGQAGKWRNKLSKAELTFIRESFI
jgi:hypothetical protein